jgi:DNA-directed RNA polymerase I, II, and III subunit RPABC2
MPPKKDSSKSKVQKTKPVKNVKFDKEENSNTLIKTPIKEKYPDTANLNLDENELEKETELETEIEVEEEAEAEVEDLEDQENDLIDEDHEVEDEIEYDEEPNVEENDMDDLYDDIDNVKSKKKPKTKKKSGDDDELNKFDEDECEYNYDDIYDEKKEEPSVIVEASQRITLPKLTKYERVRMIGTRAKQISLGAKVMVKNTAGLNPIEIAKIELEHRMIPMKIKRVLPDNKIEIWKLSELELDN